jgi:hypothetical protein
VKLGLEFDPHSLLRLLGFVAIVMVMAVLLVACGSKD